MKRLKEAYESAPAWAFGPHGPCIFRFSSRLEIESDRDKIRLDCFPSIRTINMYPMLFVKEERQHVSQTTILGAPPPLILGFHPSKRHAALIARSVVLAFTLVLLVLKHFWCRVVLVILMFVAWFLVDSSCFYCLSSTNIMLFLCMSCSNLMLILIA